MCLLLQTLADDYERNGFRYHQFYRLVVVVGNTTWEVMNAKKALKIEWEKTPQSTITVSGFWRKTNR
jgi:isoquinoline 1-oxidoreductase beta subunit